MPRKDLTEERTAQIIEAFETCILRYGLESSSLEKVATEAGLKRPIIRHYVGNRDELVIKLTDHLIDRFRLSTAEMIDALGTDDRIGDLITILMSRDMEQSADAVMIFEHLVMVSSKMDPVRKRIADWTTEFLGVIENELIQAYPDSEGHSEVAYGIVSIYYNSVSLAPLGLHNADHPENSARRLLVSLER